MSVVPLRIHVWAPSFDSFGGGITAFSRELVLALQSDEHDIRLFGKQDRGKSWNGAPLSGANGRGTVYFAANVIGSVAIRRPDVVISTHVNFGPAASIAQRLFGTPYVLVAHGVDVHQHLSRRRRQSIHDANAIWAVSEWTKRRVMEAGGVDENLKVIGNTVDDQRFTPGDAPPALRSRYGLKSAEKVILTVGRLNADEAYKGYDAVVRSLPALRSAIGSVRYLIAGSGDDRPRIEALAASIGVSDMVKFCGFVADDELADHYRLADVYAMPSIGEGFGIVFLESMASGTPVLAGNNDGAVDALANGELGELVDAHSDREVTDGLLRLLRHEGPAWWYEPNQLRSRMLAFHGRDAFRKRIREAIAMVSPRIRT